MKQLLKVQQQIGTLSKNSKNPFFKSQYLDLTTLLEHVTPILNDNGLILMQPITGDSVTSCILDAETGETIASSTLNLPNQQDPQKMGSAVTYYRRYTLKSLLAIAEVDDDGNLASKPPKVETKKIFRAEDASIHVAKKTTLETLKTMFQLTPDQEVKYTKLLKDGAK